MHDFTTNPLADQSAMPAPQAPAQRKPRELREVLPNAVDGAGLPQYAFDSRTIHAQYRTRGYLVTLCWMLDPETDTADGAMVLVPERMFGTDGAWAITRRAVMRFCDEHNKPTRLMFVEAAKALPVLGHDTIRAEVIRLVDVVMNHVDDLVQMPSPTLATRLLLQGDPMWDVTIHERGAPNKVKRETTI